MQNKSNKMLINKISFKHNLLKKIKQFLKKNKINNLNKFNYQKRNNKN